MTRISSFLNHQQLRLQVQALCACYPNSYWRELDKQRQYPEEFVTALTQVGYLSALIPKKFGGLGMSLTEASVILEEIHKSGGHAAACHAQMYIMGALLKHGSEYQKKQYLPDIATGKLRLQAFSITEPEAGSDTTNISTFAKKEGDFYVVNGHKNWTSRIEQSDLLMLLARISLKSETDRTSGISLFLIDLREIRTTHPEALEVTPVRTMFNYATYDVKYHNMRISRGSLIGEEGQGFRYVIDGWNAERILLAAECIGDGYWLIERAVEYANKCNRFGVPIGKFQGVQFPIAEAYTKVRAADAMRYQAAALFDSNQPCGAEANMAKLLASEASWAAANICLNVHGGNGFVDQYDIERKFRETRMYQVAPVNNNMILGYLAHNILGMPKSY